MCGAAGAITVPSRISMNRLPATSRASPRRIGLSGVDPVALPADAAPGLTAPPEMVDAGSVPVTGSGFCADPRNCAAHSRGVPIVPTQAEGGFHPRSAWVVARSAVGLWRLVLGQSPDVSLEVADSQSRETFDMHLGKPAGGHRWLWTARRQSRGFPGAVADSRPNEKETPGAGAAASRSRRRRCSAAGPADRARRSGAGLVLRTVELRGFMQLCDSHHMITCGRRSRVGRVAEFPGEERW